MMRSRRALWGIAVTGVAGLALAGCGSTPNSLAPATLPNGAMVQTPTDFTDKLFLNSPDLAPERLLSTPASEAPVFGKLGLQASMLPMLPTQPKAATDQAVQAVEQKAVTGCMGK